MGHSSRYVVMVVLVASPALAQGPSPGVSGQAAHVSIAPHFMPNPGRRSFGDRPHHGGGFATGLIGPAIGFAVIGGDVSPDEAEAPGTTEADMPPPIVIPGIGPERPCIMPQIIEVGRGLRPSARVRVVYGMPADCAYP